MKDYSKIISTITTTPWMMMPSALKMMLEIVDAHLDGRMPQEQIEAAKALGQARHGNGVLVGEDAPPVGIMRLHGPIFPKANLMTEMSGATSLDQWSHEFQGMVMDDRIESIIIDVDSPGGSSAMIPETAQMIRQAREVKPIYAVANTMAASAAYGLAAQATALFASPSSIVGSVGTYLVHTDDSALADKVGVKETVIKAGRFKAVELESLTPESREYLQELVNDVNNVFIGQIAEGRDLSREHVIGWEAKALTPQRAVDASMIDSIATFDEVLANTVGGGSQSTPIAVTASVSGSSFQGNTIITTTSTANPGRRQSYDADKEHSEPGTGLGGEPTPREPPEEGDPAIEGGWRRDSPPAAFEEPEESMNREWLETMAASLSVTFTDETTDEELATAISSAVQAVVVPLNSVTLEVTEQRAFEEQYPEQARQLQELAQRDREHAAESFASEFSRLPGNRSVTPEIRSLLADNHLRVATRQFTEANLAELVTALTAPNATYPAGQTGSSRESEAVGSTGNFNTDRQEFAALVRNRMKEDSLTQEAAIKLVAEENPQLAQSYAMGHV